MNLNETIDHFVKVAIKSGAEIIPIDRASWIEALEEKLPVRLPASFRSLITRYQYEPFEVGGIRFLANLGSSDRDEMAVEIFYDPIIKAVTLANGYIQFARPADGSYDVVCFDTNGRSRNREYPIVRVDHEQILCHNRIGKPAQIAASFLHFASEVGNG